jgi:hypothetical protein
LSIALPVAIFAPPITPRIPICFLHAQRPDDEADVA